MVDWQAVEKRWPPDKVSCYCGGIFVTHTELDFSAPKGVALKDACPKCGRKDNFHMITYGRPAVGSPK